MLKKIFIFLCLTINSTIMVNAEEIDYNARALVGATEQVLITSEIAAKINNIGFTNGEPFLKGDILIAFDCELFEAQREVIQANFDSADVQLKNDKDFYKECSDISKKHYYQFYSVEVWKENFKKIKLVHYNSEEKLDKVAKHSYPFLSLQDIGFQATSIQLPNYTITEKLISEYEATRNFPATKNR